MSLLLCSNKPIVIQLKRVRHAAFQHIVCGCIYTTPICFKHEGTKNLSRLCREVQCDPLKSLIKDTKEEMRKGFVYDRSFLVCLCKLFQICEGRKL